MRGKKLHPLSRFFRENSEHFVYFFFVIVFMRIKRYLRHIISVFDDERIVNINFTAFKCADDSFLAVKIIICCKLNFICNAGGHFSHFSKLLYDQAPAFRNFGAANFFRPLNFYRDSDLVDDLLRLDTEFAKHRHNARIFISLLLDDTSAFAKGLFPEPVFSLPAVSIHLTIGADLVKHADYAWIFFAFFSPCSSNIDKFRGHFRQRI